VKQLCVEHVCNKLNMKRWEFSDSGVLITSLPLPTFWSRYSDLSWGEDEASMNTCHYLALYPIKCCHWNCQLT